MNDFALSNALDQVDDIRKLDELLKILNFSPVRETADSINKSTIRDYRDTLVINLSSQVASLIREDDKNV